MNTKINANQADYDEDVIDLYELWQTIWMKRKFIFIFCSIAVVLTAIISLIMTPMYRSTTTVLPISSKPSMMGGMSDLAALAGLSMGGGDDTTKIMAVLNSRTIKEQVITEQELIKEIFEEDRPEDRNPMLWAIEEFEDMVSISSDKKTTLISISIEDENPERAMRIADSYVRSLKDILNSKSLSVSKIKRDFLEKQLVKAEKRMKKGQRRMVAFQKRTKLIDPGKQASGTFKFYSELVSKKTELEVKYQTMEAALATGSPMLKSLKRQLSIINKKISHLEGDGPERASAVPTLAGAPEKMSQYADRYRDIQISGTIYKTLVQMYEQAKLEEAREGIFIQVIDQPVVADKRFKPKRALMVLVAAFTSGFLAVFIIFFMEWINTIKEEKGLKQENPLF